MTASVIDRIDWNLKRDKDGYRNYDLKWRVRTTDVDDGPTIVLGAAGLPLIGAVWNFGNDSDPWAFCLPECEIEPQVEEEVTDTWIVTQHFSNRPITRCQDTTVDDPLVEPPELGGTFLKQKKEATKDRFGRPLLTSSLEVYRNVERNESLPTINVSMNIGNLPLHFYAAMADHVNGAKIWGFGPRKVRLSDISWARKYYGQCHVYYKLSLGFEVKYDGWDVHLVDEGTRRLVDGGNRANQLDYVVHKDRQDENTKILLNGRGQPLLPVNGVLTPVVRKFELDDEADFLLIGGLPTAL